MIECELTINNKLGLHARAAAKLSSCAGRYAAKIEAGIPGNKFINVKSVMSVMLLAASQGTVLHFRFCGDDADKAHKAIQALIEDKFGEDA